MDTSAQNYARIFLLVIFSFNVLLWLSSHHIRMPWPGIPPAPSKNGALSTTLGDAQFFYRFGALTLQNVGDTGGRNQSFAKYDYNDLKPWFWLLHELDGQSNHIPMAAAFYFGATKNPEKTRIIVDYLAEVGLNEDGDRWRWLAHAVFLARYNLKDIDYALELAYKLSSMNPVGDSLPMWARHMPVFVLTAMDEKEAAIALMEGVLLTASNLPQTEKNFIRSYLTERLYVEEEHIGSSLVSDSK